MNQFKKILHSKESAISPIRGKIRRGKLSLCIPYKQRLDNLKVLLDALTHQTMRKDDFEVIIGAMEYCENFVALCKKYLNHLNLISILSPDKFSIPHARNLAMRQATGEIIVQMDADTLLPPKALQSLYDRHFSFGQKICVVGQVIGYGNNNDGYVEKVRVQPYESYKEAIAELENSTGNPKDPRFQVPHIIPWAFGWTGFIALPLDVVRENNFYFDETFHGWGVDDLEWSYRICKSRTPIVLCEDVRAIHLPHARDPEANNKTETKNYKRFLLKWPTPDVELAHFFGDVEANSLYLKLKNDIRKAIDPETEVIGAVHGTMKEKNTLLIGVILNKDHQIINSKIESQFDHNKPIETLPLIGMALPYNDNEIDECQILHPISVFSKIYSEAVFKEVKRVAKNYKQLF